MKTIAVVGFEEKNYIMHNKIAKLLGGIVFLVDIFILIFTPLGHSVHSYRNNDTSLEKGFNL